MPNVDEKVVQMTFDNKQFEKGVSQSLKSLEDLKKALEFDSMRDSLRRLETVTSTMTDSLSTIMKSTQKVANVFTPLGNLGAVALQRLSNAALDAGKNFLKMATGLDSMSAGQKKYEDYTKAVQTITNATGKTVNETTVVLDKLSKYTDETSYDFSEMVSSIGKFTSVGIDLERAEAAMEGIANWAAKSGAGKQAANRAMYNISQAMGVGAMKKIDWKSIENANMATKEFKETAIQTAIEMGVLGKEGENVGSVMKGVGKNAHKVFVDYQSFAETLSLNWLTSDVLTEVLARYGDQTTEFGLAAFHAAQEALTFTDAIDALKDAVSSGWMRSFELMFGNLNEARVMWTNFANAIIEFSDIFSSARNTILKGWHDQGGYNAAIEAASNIWHTFMNVVDAVGSALASVFPVFSKYNFDSTAKSLANLTKQLRDVTGLISNKTSRNTETEVEREFEVITDYARKLNVRLNKSSKNSASAIESLQQRLINAGYMSDKAIADGVYGPETEKAIKKLQKDLGVKVTGEWDKATRIAAVVNKTFVETETNTETVVMQNVEETTRKIKEEINLAEQMNKELLKGSKGDDVKRLQEQLIQKGYLKDKTGADGIYGPKTQEAIKKLQKDLGVDITGAWDKATIAAAIAQKSFVIVEEKEEKVYEKTQGLTRESARLEMRFNGFFSIIKIGKSILDAFLKVVGGVAAMFKPLADPIEKFSTVFMNMFTNLSYEVEGKDVFGKIADNILNALGPVGKVIQDVADGISKFTAGYISFLNDNGKAHGFDRKRNTFANFFEYTRITIKEGIRNTIERIRNFAEEVKNAISYVLTNGVVADRKYIRKFDKNPLIVGWKEKFASIKKHPIIVGLTKLFTAIKKVVTSIADFVTNMFNIIFGKNGTGDKAQENQNESKTNWIVTVFNTILNVLTTVGKGIGIALGVIAFAFTTLFNVLKPIVQPISDGIINLTTSLKNLIADGQIKTVPDFLKNLWKSFTENTAVGKFLSGIGDKIKGAFETVKTYVQTEFPKVLDFFEKAWEDVQAFFNYDSDKTFLENLTDKLGPAINKLKSFGKKLKAAVWIFTNRYDALVNPNEKEQKAIESNPLYKFLRFLATTIEKIKAIGKRIKSAAWILTKHYDSLVNPNDKELEAIDNYPLYKFLRFLALGIDSIKRIIGTVKTTGKNLWGAIQTIINPSDENIETNKDNKIYQVLNSVINFIVGLGQKIRSKIPVIAGTFSMLWEAIKTLINPSEENLEKNKDNKIYQVLSSIVDFFVGIGKRIKSALPGIVESLSGLWEAIKNLFHYDSDKSLLDNLKSNIQPLVDWFIELKDKLVAAWNEFFSTGDGEDPKKSGFISVLDKIKEFFTGLVGIDFKKLIGPAIGAFAAYATIKSVRAFSRMSKVMDKGLAGVIFGGGANDDKDSFGDTALKIAGAITSIALVVGLLSIIDAKKAWKGIAVFETVLWSFVAALAVVRLIDKKFGKDDSKKGISPILQFAGAVGILVLSLYFMINILRDSSSAEITDSLWIIGGMLAALAVVSKITGRSSKIVSGSGFQLDPILSMCLGILVLVFAIDRMIAIIRASTYNELEYALMTIGKMLLLVGSIAIAINVASKDTLVDTKVGGIIGMCFGVLVLAFAFEKMVNVIKNNKQEDVDKAAWFIGGVLVALGVVAVLLGAFATGGMKSLGVIGEILAIAIGVGIIVEAFTKALKALKGTDVTLMETFFRGILIVVGVFAAIAVVLGLIPTTVLVQGLLGILAVVGIIAGAVKLIGGIAVDMLERFASALWLIGAKFSQFNDMLSSLDWDNLEKVGNYLKSTVPAMILAIIQTDMETAQQKMLLLIDIGACLANYAESLKAITADVLLNSAIAKIMVEDAKVIADSLKDFSIPTEVENGHLALLGGHLSTYSGSLEGLTLDYVDTAKSLAASAQEIANSINAVSVNEGAPEQLTKLGAALKLYYGEISGIGKVDANGEALSEEFQANLTHIDSQMVSEAFTALANAIPIDQIGTIASFAPEGDNSLTNFALGITAIGTALKGYGEDISALNVDQINSANTAIDGIVGLDEHLKKPNWNGIFGFLDGDSTDDTISAFSGHIVVLGSALKTYGMKIGTLRSGKVQAANDVLDKMKDLDGYLKAVTWSDVFSAFGLGSERQNIVDFGLDIQELGNSLGLYITSIEGIDKGKIEIANGVLDVIANLNNKLPKSGGFLGWLTGEANLGEFASNMGALGEGVKEYANNVAQANFDNVKESSDLIRPLGFLVGSFGDYRNGVLKSFGGDLNEFATKLTTFKDNISGLTPEAFDDAFQVLERVLSWGTTFSDISYLDSMGGYHNKLDDIGVGLNRIFTEIAKLSTTEMKALVRDEGGNWGTEKTPLFEAFSMVGTQLLNGLSGSIINAETENGIIKDAIQQALLIAMNSLTFAESEASTATGIGTSFASSLLTALMSGSDLQPVIRPVLDLSSVETNADRLKQLVNPTAGSLSLNYTSSIAHDVATMSSSLKTAIETSVDKVITKMDEQNEKNAKNMSLMVGRINSMKNEIGRMKVYLDKNRLVGGIITDIDRQLGQNSYVASRNS